MRTPSRLAVLLSLASSACGSSSTPDQPTVLDVGVVEETAAPPDTAIEDTFVAPADAVVDDVRTADADAETAVPPACAPSVVDVTLSPSSALSESLAYDSAGQPHVVYAVSSGSERRARYATRVGSTWTTEPAGDDTSVAEVSIAVVAGKPRVAAAEGSASTVVVERDGTWKRVATLAGNSSGLGVVLASRTDSVGAYQLSALLKLATYLEVRDLPPGSTDWVRGPLLTSPSDARALRIGSDRIVHYAYVTSGTTREIRVHTYASTSTTGPAPIGGTPTLGAPIAIGEGATPGKDGIAYAEGTRWMYVEPLLTAQVIRDGDIGYGTPQLLRSGGTVYAAVYSGAPPAKSVVHLMKQVGTAWVEVMAADASSSALVERAPGKVSLLARRKTTTASDLTLFECP